VGTAADPDPTGWFEALYAAAEAGEAVVPWYRRAPNRRARSPRRPRFVRGRPGLGFSYPAKVEKKLGG
jgi:hypothetical protein